MKGYLRYPEVSVDKLYKKWSASDPVHFKKAAEKLPGCRTLNQDPFECLIGFMMSSNNNIGRIKGIV